jgi:hypothetical protein
MTKTFFLFLILTLGIFKVHSQNEDCLTSKQYIDSTVQFLIQNNDTGFAGLASITTFKSFLEEKVKQDTTKKSQYLLDMANESPDNFSLMFLMSFKKLHNNFMKLSSDSILNIKLEKHEITRTEDDGILKHHTVKVYVSTDSISAKFTLYLSEYKGCIYMIEPPEGYVSEIK